MRNNTTLTGAVVGCGTGGMLSVRALLGSERYELVGVADTSEDARVKVVEAGLEADVFPDATALLASVLPDVLCVSTLAPSHAQIVQQGLEAGVRGLLLEKPIALDWKSGRGTLDLLVGRQTPVVVPHGLLVRTAPLEVLRRISEGDIGEVEVIEIECAGWDLINAGVHWVDFALAILGDDRVQSVLAACDVSTRTFRDGIEVETEAVTYAVSRSGVRVVMQTGDHVRPARAGKELVYRVYGNRGSIEFWGWEDRYSLHAGAAGSSTPMVVDTGPGVASAHQIYLEMLADMVASGEPRYELAELSLRALEICEAAYLSNRHRCVVALPLAAFAPPPAQDWDPGAQYRGRAGRDGRRL